MGGCTTTAEPVTCSAELLDHTPGPETRADPRDIAPLGIGPHTVRVEELFEVCGAAGVTACRAPARRSGRRAVSPSASVIWRSRQPVQAASVDHQNQTAPRLDARVEVGVDGFAGGELLAARAVDRDRRDARDRGLSRRAYGTGT